MARHVASCSWRLGEGEDFAAGRYSRRHELRFDGGAVLDASASPQVVGRWAAPAAVDPEELLVAALSSCHMLSFLHAARLAGFVAGAYADQACGWMEENDSGRLAVTRVELRPHVAWRGPAPDAAALARLHHQAHEACFIANSVRTEVTVLPETAEGSTTA